MKNGLDAPKADRKKKQDGLYGFEACLWGVRRTN